jgi:hypothetical protein
MVAPAGHFPAPFIQQYHCFKQCSIFLLHGAPNCGRLIIEQRSLFDVRRHMKNIAIASGVFIAAGLAVMCLRAALAYICARFRTSRDAEKDTGPWWF